MQNSTLHPKLAHLSESQIEEIISRYYAGEKIIGLLEYYGINCAVSTFHKYLPPEISDEPCPNCGAVMEIPRHCRKSNGRNTKASPRCANCQHGRKSICECQFCDTERMAIRDKKPNTEPNKTQTNDIQSWHKSIKPDDLTFDQAVSILALTSSLYSINTNKGMLLITAKLDKVPFAPTPELSEELVNRLVEAGLLAFVDQATIRGVPMADKLTTHRSQATLQWRLPEPLLTTLIQEIEQIAKNGDWPQHWYTQIEELAFDLAFAECIEFYDWCAEERQFPNVKEKSKSSLIRNLLEDFSVGQCCRGIHAGSQYASDHLVKTDYNLQKAASYMLGACQRWADRARAENWDLKPYRRNVNCPRSMMSYVLYDTFLNIGEEAFNTPVTLIKKFG
jgi:hypothetical protein